MSNIIRKEIHTRFMKDGVLVIGLPCVKIPYMEKVYFLDTSGKNDINTTLYVGDKIIIGNDIWKFTTLSLTKNGEKVAYFNVCNNKGKRIKSFFINDNESYLLSLNQDTIDKYGIISKIKKNKEDDIKYVLKTRFVGDK